MKVRTKRNIRILLSALLVLVMAFQSLAAPVSYAGPTAESEPAKVTGTWSKDAAGNWNFNAQDGAAKDGWYYLNTTNKATDYNWFHFTNGVMNTGWIQDKTDLSVWYYTGETKDSSEGGMVKGWATDPRDGKRYYMDPSTGIMRYGWQLIGNVWYYFGEKQYANASHPYGAMYVNERTPDGYYVGSNGGWIQNHSENDSDDPVGPVVVPVTGVSLDKSEVTLGVGDTCTLNAAVAPANATNKNVTWSSDNTDVATVDTDGKVTAVAAGEATITVTTVDGGKTATCTVTVKPATETKTVAEILGTVSGGFPGKQNAWVADNGNICYKEVWSSDLTFEHNNLGSTLPVSSSVTKDENNYVYEGDYSKITFTMGEGKLVSITFYSSSEYTNYNGTYKAPASELKYIKDVLATVEGNFPTSASQDPPTDAWVDTNGNKCYVYDEMLNFYKDQENSYGVSTSLNVTAGIGNNYVYQDGSVSITFTMDNEKLKNIEVTGDQYHQYCAGTYAPATPPVVPVTSVSIEPDTLELPVGEEQTLSATVLPEDATNKNVTWSSDNTDVATVDTDGKVTAVAAGEATITVTTVDGSKTATCTVTVTTPTPTISTIADVLATVEGGFPTSTDQNTVPDNAWHSRTNHFAYVYSTAMIIKQPTDEDGSKAGWTPILLNNPVTKDGDSYTYSHTIFNLTFKMEDGILTAIKITGSSATANTKHDGTYEPASASPLLTAPLEGSEEVPAAETASIEARAKETVEDAEAEKDLSIPVEALETEIPEAVVPEIAAEAKPEEVL